MFFSRWFRNFIRRHTTRKSEQEAIYWSDKLSTFYVFCAWNAAGLAVAAALNKYKNAKIGEQKNRERDALERTLTWGGITARVVKPHIEEVRIEAIETNS